MLRPIALTLCALLLAAGAQAADRLRLQLAWEHQFEFAGFYAAEKQGYYRDAGLEVEIRPWNGTYSLTALENGEADVAIVGSPVLQMIAEGKSLQLLGVTFQHSPLVFLSHEPILRLRTQLQGRRIMGAHTFELRALLHRAGLSLDDITLVPHSHGIAPFIRGEVDIFSAFSTNQPYQLRALDEPFWMLDPKSYGIDSYQDLWVIRKEDGQARPQVFERFRQASLEGWQYAVTHPDEIIDYIRQLGSRKSREELYFEMETALPLIHTGEYPLGTLDLKRLQRLFDQLHNLGFITDAQLANMNWKTLVFNARITSLTRAELDWIRENPVIRLANDIAWPPFEYIDAQGRYRGMIPDLLELVSERTGLKFIPETEKGWQEVVQAVRTGELDMFSAAVATPEREKFARFTPPFFRFPMVALAREGHPVIPDLEKLEQERIGVVAGYSSDEILSHMDLQSTLVRYPTVDAGLNALVRGEINVLVDNLVSLNYLIRQKGLDGLVVVGQLGEPFALSMGIRKDLPVLYSIISKTLDNISEADKQAIYDRWLQLKIINETDHSLLLKVVSLAGLVVLLLFALIGWQRRLSNQLQRRLQEVQELTLSTETDPDGRIQRCTHSFARLLASSQEELIGQIHPLFQYGQDPEQMRTQLEQGQLWNEEVTCWDLTGRKLYLQFQARPLLRHHRLTAVRISGKNLTSEKLLEQASLQDSLTGLSNRRHFNQVFEKEVLRARRNGQTFYWAMLDLDHFKNLNDALGHQKGDEALMEVADVFRAHFSRAGDGIFRLGGEEFGLMIQLQDEKQLKPKLEALRQAVEDLAIPNPNETSGVLTISIGAVIVPPDISARPEWIYHQADEMLYQAKAAGRNKVMITRLSSHEPQRAQAK